MKFILNVFKSLIYIIFFILSLVVITLIAIQYADLNKYKDTIAENLKKTTGMDLTVDGDLKLNILPRLQMQMNKIKVKANVNQADYLLSADALGIDVDGWALLLGNIVFDKVDFTEVIVREVKSNQDTFQAKRISTHLKATQDYVFFSDLHVEHATGTYQGDLRFILHGDYNEIAGKFKSENVHIAVNSPTTPSDKLPEIRLPFAGISFLKGNVTLDAKKLRYNTTEIENAMLRVDLDRKAMKVNLTGKPFQGDLNIALSAADSSSKIGKVNLDIQLKNADAAALLSVWNPSLAIKGGKAEFIFKGNTQGITQSALLSHLDGKGHLHVMDVHILNKSARSISLSDNVFNILSKNKQEKLQCFVGKFNIRNGVVQFDQTIGLETKYIVGLGSGTLNLNNQTMDIVINMAPLSKSPIELGDFEGMLVVKGTLSNPNVSVHPNMTRDAASVIMGFATGGLSLLGEAVLNMTKGQRSPCSDIMKSN